MALFSARLLKQTSSQPQGFYAVLYTEVCELFGQFGISALLTLYMTSVLRTSDQAAFSCYGAFSAFIYAIPMIGGYFADRIIGLHITLLSGIGLMTIGNMILFMPNLHALYWGLAVFSVGCGFFTPSITTVLGRLYSQEDSRRDNAFILYYIAKNLGVFFATVVGGLVATRFGYNDVFFVSMLVMFSGGVVFWVNSQTLDLQIRGRHRETQLNVRAVFSLIATYAVLIVLAETFISHGLTRYFVHAAVLIATFYLTILYRQFDPVNRKKMKNILLSIGMMMVFFMFLGQGGTTLNLFIERIVDRQIAGFIIPPSLFYALDPLFMMLAGGGVMAALAKIKAKNEIVAGFYKISAGLMVLGLGFLVFVGAASVLIFSGAKPSVAWVVFAYLLFPIAELCVMPIVISLITRIAPVGYEGVMIGIYMLGCAVSSYFTGVFSKIGNVNFALDTLPALVHGAQIYRHVFLLSTLFLLGIVLIFVMMTLFSSVVKKMDSGFSNL